MNPHSLPPLFADCVVGLAHSVDWGKLTEAQHLAHGKLELSSNPGRLEQVVREPPAPIADSGKPLPVWQFDGTWAPAMHLRHGVEGGRAVLTLSLVIAKLNSGGDEVVATGWRFEPPEGPGEHRFWHAQPLRIVRTDKVVGFKLPGVPAWLPDDRPAVPLRARDETEMLVCALVSLYGFDTLDRWQDDHLDSRLHDHLESLKDV